MKKCNKITLIISVIVCVTLILSISLYYFLAKPHITCCRPEFVYTFYSHPSNSTNHFSIFIINYGPIEGSIQNMTSIWFKNSTNTYYPSNVKGNGMEVSFPLIIEPEVEINITLELDWYFTIGTEYYLYIEYDLGRTLRVIFTANTIN